MAYHPPSRNRGFSLVELLIVISIIGFLATMGIVVYSGTMRDSRNARRRVELEKYRSALELFRSNQSSGSYPTTLNLLVPTYIQAVNADPLGVAYVYAPLPVGCSSGGPTFCTTYTLTIPAEPAAAPAMVVTPNSL